MAGVLREIGNLRMSGGPGLFTVTYGRPRPEAQARADA
jgi:hypothetical protein